MVNDVHIMPKRMRVNALIVVYCTFCSAKRPFLINGNGPYLSEVLKIMEIRTWTSGSTVEYANR